jgi:hypothetical protein
VNVQGFARALACVLGVIASVAALAAGCGSDNGIVGGACAPGYTPCGSQQCCLADASVGDGATGADGSDASYADATDATGTDSAGYDGTFPDVRTGDGGFPDDGSSGEGASSDGATGDGGSAGDGATEGGVVCTPPLVDCAGSCVDTTSDPFNCGGCGNFCPSLLCVSSACVGSTGGGIVFIGHDYATTAAGTSQARVLSNAVFIAQNNPLNVLSYEHYALASAVTHVKTILDGVAKSTGRTISITSTSTDADIPNKLTPQAYAVLLVHDQPSAPAGALATLGGSWQSTLSTFTQQGGIVVVLDGGSGVGEMPAFATATTLLDVSAQSNVAVGTPLSVVAPADAVGVGVVSPYAAGKTSVSLLTEPNGGNIIYVVQAPNDAGPGAPVVVHKAL